jgi:hypothetical protein
MNALRMFEASKEIPPGKNKLEDLPKEIKVEEHFKPIAQPQRRLNPTIKEVVKLLDAKHRHLVYLYQASYDFVEVEPLEQSR